MKRIIAVLIAGMAFVAISSADNDRAIPFSKLPEPAKEFIKANYPDEKISYSKQEKDFMEVSYEVVFANGTKVEFDGRGQWKEIDCRYSVLNPELIPARIREYVSQNYPGTSFVKIERGKRDIEVKITNGLELTFDLEYNLIDIDD